ncbi:MAG: 30S ribosomal protein S16 [Candidatus Spechtbacteria bacterium SB0662_bin_43]|uniref:Small ribosomal subunit protein bS16 n=1 Tax=Candidatus Spechtbacteria bacterium SB0662_bin_43 TaxID=2604897 RepID=A0A845DBP7_9BACT|nr:30S ribosomal protein S16 [Candidatus Spechtbacteria bacterium SB0662_bin_43]
MLRLRLRRVGRKHDPSFRIVVTENTAPLKGKYLESIGFYNAVLKKREVNHERAKYWLSKGVQPTDVVHNILVTEGVIDAPKIAVHKRSQKQDQGQEQEESEDEKAKVNSEEGGGGEPSEEKSAKEEENKEAEEVKEAKEENKKAGKQDKQDESAEDEKSETKE